MKKCLTIHGMAEVPAGNRYALLIGVNKYARPISSLKYCVSDMNLLAESFEKIGAPKENIFLMTDDSTADRRPTGANIRRQISNVTRLMEERDQLVIAFSGHGVMVDGQSYLCPSDTDHNDKNSLVPREWVYEQMDRCKAKQKIFIIDACRNELSFGGSKELGKAKSLIDPFGADTRGFVLIGSCDKEQESWEADELCHGVFAHFLAEGLRGAAQDEDGYVSVLNLFQYASSKTKTYVFNHLSQVQVPSFRQGSEMSDFCLAKLSESTPVSPIAPAPATLKAGDRKVLTVDGIEYAFRWCPPGEFMMGSSEYSWEKQHRVRLTQGFWLLETEVTQEMWESVMGENPSKFYGARKPVEQVSWGESFAFCEKLSRKLNREIKLPTEAQWEYACRAGTTGAYAGDLVSMGWYGDYSGGTHEVGQKRPNAWGLYDMHGNVWEWCSDYYGKDYYEKSPTSDPENRTYSSIRVRRGGSWFSFALDCRSAYRYGHVPGIRVSFLGLRVLLVPSTEDNELVESAPVAEEVAPVETVVPAQELPNSPKAGDRKVLTVDGIEYAFRYCPAGEFMMGSPEDEPGRDDEEKQHRVRLTQGVWLLETEVTQEMWKSVMGENPSWFKGARKPVEQVSWYDSQAFCEKLSRKLNREIKLPTEAQWEYACRAGSTGAYAGIGDLDLMGWYDGNSDSKTHEVGQKRPNDWGLYDMHGNVWEWCSDYYDFDYYVESPTSDPENRTYSSYRVHRGGGWDFIARICRSASRFGDEPDYRNCNLGLRVLLVPSSRD